MNDQMTNQGMGDKPKVCNCPHHKVVPITIILIGLTLLVGALVVSFSTQVQQILIGVFLIVIGGTKLGSRKCGCCSSNH